MRILQKVRLLRLLGVLSMLVPNGQLIAQQVITFPNSRCQEIRRGFAPKDPRLTADDEIIPGQRVVQLELHLSHNATVSVIEYPRSGKNDDYYNSTIIIRRNHNEARYALAHLMKYGDVLRLDEIASTCGAPDRGSVILAFESVGSETDQGFILVRYSRDAVSVLGFPVVTTQGRLVLHRPDPDRAELWSAEEPGPGFVCTACSKYYSVHDCRIRQSAITCAKRPGLVGPLLPDNFMEHRISIRGTPSR